MKKYLVLLFIIILSANISAQNKDVKPKVTFVELGSVNCIPCKKMQPIMKAIEDNYGEQVKVIFYDVWKSEQKKYAQLYGIKLIPTQVFLDDSGKEFHRHEGFYPEEEIDKVLQGKGLTKKSKK
ncbi:thioredoxin family protein [Candidatus Bathyarchaeota archaeon]|nr:thioredoxin family protein [Candidatus Bathyarchaeota archaeon]